MRYRIPFTMFFKWFIPYWPWQSALMAVVLALPIAMVASFLDKSNLLAQNILWFTASLIASHIHSYHRRVSLLTLFCLNQAVTILSFVVVVFFKAIDLRMACMGVLLTAVATGLVYQRQPIKIQ